MARGKPGLWSAVIGSPFVAAGSWLYLFQTEFPSIVGIPFVAFGLFIVAVGAYVQAVAPSAPRLGDGEALIEKRHPTQRVATVKIAAGFPLLCATLYLFYFTHVPYVYPTVTLTLGLVLLSSGLRTYWANSLTIYYVTTERIIKEYRLLSVIRQEIPREKIRGVQERKTATESLVGLGNVRVASGGGRTLQVKMRNMEKSERFADSIRDLL